jgi:nitrogen fixation/metabolism regulation signal transduction histidine kinase
MMSKESNKIKKSLKIKIILSFFLFMIAGGTFVNAILLTHLKTQLLREGWEMSVIKQFLQQFTLYSTGASIVGIVFLVIIATYLSRSITRPLDQLSGGLMDIAGGKWSTRINIKSEDEIGHLASGFNFMAEHVEKSLQKIEASKEFTDNVLISVPSILVVLSNRKKVLSANSALARIQEQYPSLKIDHFTDLLSSEIDVNLETGNTIKKEITMVPDYADFTLIFAAIVTRIGENGVKSEEEKASVLITITDITASKKMKELVLQSKQDWEDTFNTIPDAITIHDRDYNIIQGNKAANKYYHGTDSPPEDCLSCDCMFSNRSKTFEVYEPHLKKYVEIRSIPRLNANGAQIGLIHITRDISDRKKIEEKHNKLMDEVTRAKIEWELTFDSVVENIILIDRGLKITRCNKSFSKYVKKPVSELIGQNLEVYFPSIMDHVSKSPAGPDESDGLILKKEIMTESGEWLYVTYQPIVDDNEQSLHSILITTDISDMKLTQKKLAKSEEELKKKVDDLEKFYDMAVGREIRMKELKDEIKRLTVMMSDSMENNSTPA